MADPESYGKKKDFGEDPFGSPFASQRDELTKTNTRQFELVVLGNRKPKLGETFDVEIMPYRKRIEVQCVDKVADRFLVEVMNDRAEVPKDGTRSRAIPVSGA